MEPRRRNPLMLALWIAASVVAFATPSWAVVPGLAGPMQALGQLLPQILPFLGVGVAGVLSRRDWRAWIVAAARSLCSRRGVVFGVAVAGIGVLGALMHGSGSRSHVADTAVAAPTSAGEWTMFRGDLSRSGATGSPSDLLAGRVAWTFQDPDAPESDFSSSPAVVGSRLYAGSGQASAFSAGGMVYCLDTTTGKRVWQFQTSHPVFSSPAVAAGRVYFGEGLHIDADCKVFCLDAGTGRLIWSTPTKSHTESSPAVADGKVYVGAGDDGVYCLDAGTGSVVWHYGDAHADGSPAVVDGKVFIGSGYRRQAALALDAATGQQVWSVPCDLAVWGPASVAASRVYFGIGNGDFGKSAATPRGAVWCLDETTGRQLWRGELPDAAVGAVALRDGKAYTGCRDGKVYSLDAASGKTLWSADCGGPVVASAALGSRYLYAAGSRGHLVALDLGSGHEAWKLDLAARSGSDAILYGSPALAGGRLYVGTAQGELLSVGQ